MYTHDTMDQLQLAFYSGLNIVFETLWGKEVFGLIDTLKLH